MPLCSFDRESAMYDVTPIENMFLLEYLPMAPEDYLRVYLYARMLCQHPELAEEVGDLARALKIDEETVTDAFRYWERQGLVKRLTDRPPTYAVLPMRAMSAPEPMEKQYYEFRDFNASLQALFGANLIHGEIKIAHDWVLALGYEKDAAVRIVEYGLADLKYSRANVRATFKKLDQVAVEWADRGARSLEDVERMIAWENGSYKAAEAVIKQFSQRRRPTKDELKLADKWVHEWGLSIEDLLDACRETVKATKPSFAYLDRVLESRKTRSGQYFDSLKSVLVQLGSQALPTPETLKRYREYLDLGFEERTIELAAACQNSKDKHQFDDLERILAQWAALGLYRADAAEAYVQSQRQLSAEVSEILKRAGSERRPRLEDNKLLEQWKARFSPELIFYAAEKSREKGRPMATIDRQLEDWQRAGIATLDAARAYAPTKPAGRANNPALNYEQRTYTEEESERDFYIDLLKEYEGGRK